MQSQVHASDVLYSGRIDPVPEGVMRPFWSVMMPTYERTTYLEQALRSVLDQAPSRELMQIQVVDNCSAADIEGLVKSIGGARVAFYRQPRNLGATANWNACMNLARGHWVHILSDDDYILPGFYDCLQRQLEQRPEIGAAFCRHIYMDSDGKWLRYSRLELDTPGLIPDWLNRIALEQRIETPSIVVRRSVYEKLGGFRTDLDHAQDWEMWRRIAVLYPVWFEPQPLACYRQHQNSDTWGAVRTGKNVSGVCRSIDIARAYLPHSVADALSSQAKENYALVALRVARQALVERQPEVARSQIVEVLKCTRSKAVVSKVANLLAWSGNRYVRLKLRPIGRLSKAVCRRIGSALRK